MAQQIFNVLTTSALLYVVALGLFVIFGVMNVINFAHGAFLLVGAYSAFVVSNADASPWLAFALSPFVGLVFGAIVEIAIVRRLYARPLDTILATWGLSIVVTQLVMLRFGRGVQYVEAPLSGSIDLPVGEYPKYRTFILAVALVLTGILALVSRLTEWGLIGRSVIMNEDLARAIGIDIAKVRLITFAIGSALAAFAGAALVPIISVDPNLGLAWLIPAFMVVLVAGISLVGLALSALLLGASQVLASFYISSVVGSLAIVLLAVVLLRVAPFGLRGLPLLRRWS